MIRFTALALAAVVGLASTAQAAPKPQITDATGDQLPVAGSGYDIVSTRFSTEGTTVKVGRKKVYTPTKLVLTTTYAGAVPTDQYAIQVVQFDSPGCADVYLESYAGGTYGSADCFGDESFDFSVKASGKTLKFTVPFNVLGKAHLHKGAVLTNLFTYTAFGDPVVGYETGQFAAGEPGGIDHAETTAAYRVS